MLLYQKNVRNHMKNVKIQIQALSAIVNMVTNGNMVLVLVRKSEINTLTPKHSILGNVISYFKYTQCNKFMIGLGSYFRQKATTSGCISFHIEVILYVSVRKSWIITLSVINFFTCHISSRALM